MQLSSLAAKQKRILEWASHQSHIPSNSELRQRLNQTLSRYSKIIEECWEKEEITDVNAALLRDLERQLETINEDLRLKVPATKAA